ncbi:MAG: 50S ribosomal protein L25/general stress protein Ctc [Gammaproteobacteria bacterium]
MSTIFTIIAQNRADVGKGASRRLRRSDLVPAIVYGAGKEPVNITVEQIKFLQALSNEAFYTRILTLKINDQEEKVVLRDLQRHPYEPRILHADFQRVSTSEKITMRIPLHFKGGDVSPGVKLKGGVVAHLLSDIDIRCLPADLPEYVDVDLSAMDIDQTLHLSDLKLPKNTEIPGLVKDSPNDRAVASVHIPRAVVEETVAPAAVSAEVETVAEAKAKEAAAEEAKAEGATGAAPAKEKGKEKDKGK